MKAVISMLILATSVYLFGSFLVRWLNGTYGRRR